MVGWRCGGYEAVVEMGLEQMGSPGKEVVGWMGSGGRTDPERREGVSSSRRYDSGR